MSMTLEDYLDDQDMTQREFAELLGVTHQAVNQWLRGRRFPRRELIVKIEKITGGKVKPSDWYLSNVTRNRRKI